MRRFFPIALLLILFHHSLLFFPLNRLFMEVHRWDVQERIEEGKDEDLLKMQFSVAELKRSIQWVEPGEFLYQGRMYDVVRASSHEGKVQLLVYKDVEETRMRDKSERMAKERSAHEKDPTSILSFQLSKFFQSFRSTISPRMLELFGQPMKGPISLLSVFQEVPTPPPRF